jgi:hypothetical protein
MLDAAVAVGQVRGQACPSEIAKSTIEAVGDHALCPLAPSAAGKRVCSPAQRRARAGESLRQLLGSHPALPRDPVAFATRKVDEREHGRRRLVQAG